MCVHIWGVAMVGYLRIESPQNDKAVCVPQLPDGVCVWV